MLLQWFCPISWRNTSETSLQPTTELSLGVSFQTNLRHCADLPMVSCWYVLLRHYDNIPSWRCEDVPLRRLSDVPLRRWWVFHSRSTCNVVGRNRKALPQQRQDVPMLIGTNIYTQFYLELWRRMRYWLFINCWCWISCTLATIA